jgi:DNA-binding transcriptional ArsR family regulator
VAVNRKFTRIPKTTALLEAGVPTEAIPTYCCLADYSNNKTGLCWPKMETLAAILNRSVRTIQRHLHLLRELGLIEFVERRRYKGRFSSYLYRVLHIVQTTGHGRRVNSDRSNNRRTRQLRTTPKSPSKNPKEGYEWLFGDPAPADSTDSTSTDAETKRQADAKRRTDGYEWLFQ